MSHQSRQSFGRPSIQKTWNNHILTIFIYFKLACIFIENCLQVKLIQSHSKNGFIFKKYTFSCSHYEIYYVRPLGNELIKLLVFFIHETHFRLILSDNSWKVSIVLMSNLQSFRRPLIYIGECAVVFVRWDESCVWGRRPSAKNNQVKIFKFYLH